MKSLYVPERVSIPPLSTDKAPSGLYTPDAPVTSMEKDWIEAIEGPRKVKRSFAIEYHRGVIPTFHVTIPDKWPHVTIAPLYDLHIGNPLHDSEYLQSCVEFIRSQKYVISFLGGDVIENNTPGGAGSVYEQIGSPEEQLEEAIQVLSPIANKMMFSLLGNHEKRTSREVGIDVGKIIAKLLHLPYNRGYVLIILKWKGLNYRILAHHGAGGGTTAAGRINTLKRLSLTVQGCDLYFMGHLHNSTTLELDAQMVINDDGKIVNRQGFAIVCPSFMRADGGVGYNAEAMRSLSVPGMVSATLTDSGHIIKHSIAAGDRS